MKTLNLKEMEMIKGGGMNQRNCLLTGLGIMGGFAAGVLGKSSGFTFVAGALYVAASGDCF